MRIRCPFASLCIHTSVATVGGLSEKALTRVRVRGAGETIDNPGGLPVQTTVGAIRQLAPDEARRGYPVRLRGVITMNYPHLTFLFVQDESGGIYVSPENLPLGEGSSRAGPVEICRTYTKV